MLFISHDNCSSIGRSAKKPVVAVGLEKVHIITKGPAGREEERARGNRLTGLPDWTRRADPNGAQYPVRTGDSRRWLLLPGVVSSSPHDHKPSRKVLSSNRGQMGLLLRPTPNACQANRSQRLPTNTRKHPARSYPTSHSKGQPSPGTKALDDLQRGKSKT